MLDENLQFSISQYVDGTLSTPEAAALEQTLRDSAEARELLEAYQGLDAALKTALPLPDVRWDALATHLSRQVAGALEPAEASAEPAQASAQPASSVAQPAHASAQPASSVVDPASSIPTGFALAPVASDSSKMAERSSLRIAAGSVEALDAQQPANASLAAHAPGATSASSRSPLSLAWLRGVTRMAAAAIVLIVTGLGTYYIARRPGQPIGSGGHQRVAIEHKMQIEVPQVELAQGPSMDEVQIGPSAALVAQGGSDAQLDETVVSPGSKVLIASGQPLAQDNLPLPF
jgi:hypothetical protein